MAKMTERKMIQREVPQAQVPMVNQEQLNLQKENSDLRNLNQRLLQENYIHSLQDEKTFRALLIQSIDNNTLQQRELVETMKDMGAMLEEQLTEGDPNQSEEESSEGEEEESK